MSLHAASSILNSALGKMMFSYQQEFNLESFYPCVLGEASAAKIDVSFNGAPLLQEMGIKFMGRIISLQINEIYPVLLITDYGTNVQYSIMILQKACTILTKSNEQLLNY